MLVGSGSPVRLVTAANRQSPRAGDGARGGLRRSRRTGRQGSGHLRERVSGALQFILPAPFVFQLQRSVAVLLLVLVFSTYVCMYERAVVIAQHGAALSNIAFMVHQEDGVVAADTQLGQGSSRDRDRDRSAATAAGNENSNKKIKYCRRQVLLFISTMIIFSVYHYYLLLPLLLSKSN